MIPPNSTPSAISALQGVEHHRQGEAHLHVLGQEAVAVVLEHLPGVPVGGAQLPPALAQPQVEGHRRHRQIQPAGGGDPRGRRPEEHPQEKAGHQNGHVHNGHVFQSEAVPQVQRQIGRQIPPGLPREPPQPEQPRRHAAQEGPLRRRVGHGHRPAGNGAEALGGVLPVPVRVPDVVDDIHQGGRRAEGQHGADPLSQQTAVQQLSAEHQGQDHQDILDGVLGPKQPKIFSHAVTPLFPGGWALQPVSLTAPATGPPEQSPQPCPRGSGYNSGWSP